MQRFQSYLLSRQNLAPVSVADNFRKAPLGRLELKGKVVDIFLSYAKEDRKNAKIFVNELKAEGYAVWWDMDLLPGQTYQDKINERLKTPKAIIVLWTPSSVKSNWVLSEANRALSYNKLIPIVTDDLPAIDLPAPHDTVHYISRNEREKLRDSLHFLGVKIVVPSWKPLHITKFERHTVYDVGGGLALDSDYAEGRFTRDEGWEFEVYFDDKPSDYSLPKTRFSEFYIKHCGVTQWWWGAGDEQDERPNWHFG